jgi:adenylate kinase family enzyme
MTVVPTRFLVMGSTGSGKSTFARAIAARVGVPFVELDSLFWEPGWVQARPEVFRERVMTATSGDGWVVDGNYRVVTQDLIWPRAHVAVFLDYPFPLVAWRLVRRTLWRCWTRERVCGDNRERLYTHLFTRDSLFWWLIKTYWRRRREIPQWAREPAHAQVKFVRIRRPRDAGVWLQSLKTRPGATAQLP